MLLNANLKSPAPASPAPTRRAEEKLPITPNYIRSPPLGYKVDTASPQQNAVQEKRPRLESPAPGRQQQPAAAPAGERRVKSCCQQPLSRTCLTLFVLVGRRCLLTGPAGRS